VEVDAVEVVGPGAKVNRRQDRAAGGERQSEESDPAPQRAPCATNVPVDRSCARHA
jgi:hypothetical protein